VPGAKSLADMRRTIVATGVRCVFGEPQFPAALGRALTDGTPARLEVVDSLGVGVPAGPGAYAATLRRLAQAFRACLVPAA